MLVKVCGMREPENIEQVLRAQGKWLDDAKAFGW